VFCLGEIDVVFVSLFSDEPICYVVAAQTVKHVISRKQFGRPLKDFGMIQVHQFALYVL